MKFKRIVFTEYRHIEKNPVWGEIHATPYTEVHYTLSQSIICPFQYSPADAVHIEKPFLQTVRHPHGDVEWLQPLKRMQITWDWFEMDCFFNFTFCIY